MDLGFVLVVITLAFILAYQLPQLRRSAVVQRAGLGTQGATRTSGFDVRTVMAVLISLVLLAASLFVILSAGYGDDTQKWAYGVVGALIGFWLRPPSQ